MTGINEKLQKRDLVVTRLFDAPVELVWKAWTDPKYVMRWWGPNYFTCPSCQIDFRVGGTSIVGMRSPDGSDAYNTWTYREIVPLQRIEFISNLSDKDGKQADPAAMGLPADFPVDMRTVITFKAVGSQTELTVTEYNWSLGQMYEFSVLGLNQTLDKLGASLAFTSTAGPR